MANQPNGPPLGAHWTLPVYKFMHQVSSELISETLCGECYVDELISSLQLYEVGFSIIPNLYAIERANT